MQNKNRGIIFLLFRTVANSTRVSNSRNYTEKKKNNLKVYKRFREKKKPMAMKRLKNNENLIFYIYAVFMYNFWASWFQKQSEDQYAPETQLYALLNMLAIWVGFRLLTSTVCFCVIAGQSIWLTSAMGYCHNRSGTTLRSTWKQEQYSTFSLWVSLQVQSLCGSNALLWINVENYLSIWSWAPS